MTDADLAARVAKLEQQTALVEKHYGEAFWHALDVAYESILPQRQICCIVCDHAGPRDAYEILVDRCIFGGGKLERYRCPSCDCIFGPLKYLDLGEEFVSRDYEVLYSRYSEADSTANEMRTFQSLAPGRGGSYLDWGSGGAWSRTVTELRREGWLVWGYEPSSGASGKYVINRYEDLARRYDGIFSNNVIEHFRQPVAQFRQFHEILKDGGRMAHSSPCYDYSYAFTRFHTVFLLGRSAEVLAGRTGFKVTDIVRDGEYINYVFARI